MLKISCMASMVSLVALVTPASLALLESVWWHNQTGIHLKNMVFLFLKTSAK